MKLKASLFLSLLLTSSFSASKDLAGEALSYHEEMQSADEGIILGRIEGEATSFGFAGNLGKGRPAVDEHTLFEIGSITKTFTGVLLADQVLRGNAKLDDPITKFLPDSVMEDTPTLSLITLLDLATHTSGLPRLPSNLEEGANSNNPYAHYQTTQLYEYLTGISPADLEDRGQQHYSNLGMGLLGHLLELVSGKSYRTLLEETILDPLEMDETYYQWLDPEYPPNMQTHRAIPSDARERLATGHRAGLPVAYWEFGVLGGAGAIVSSASDMLRYASAFWAEGTPVALRQALQLSTKHHTETMGLGWFILDGKFSHDGGTAGFVSSLSVDPEDETATIRLENSSAPSVSESSTGDFTSVSGFWTGTLKTSAGELRQVMRIEENGSIRLHSIDQGPFGLRAARTSVEEGILTASFPTIGGTFIGSITGGKLKGTWRQSGELPLTMSRSEDAPESLQSALSKTVKGDFSSLGGYWSGYLGGPQGLFVIIEIIPIGTTADVSLYSPDQTADSLPVTGVSFDGSSFQFESKPLKATFSAEWNGETLSGEWSQGVPMPLTLEGSEERPTRE